MSYSGASLTDSPSSRPPLDHFHISPGHDLNGDFLLPPPPFPRPASAPLLSSCPHVHPIFEFQPFLNPLADLLSPPAPNYDEDPVNGYTENGRRYEGFQRGTYSLPNDDQERERLDLMAKFFNVARRTGGQLFTVPVDPQHTTPTILDLGCGPGEWAMACADDIPTSIVRAVDLTLNQPRMIPPNVLFWQLNVEDPWPPWMRPDSWDLIHIQQLVGGVKDWPALYRKIFTSLSPGYGYLEQIELDFAPRSKDDALPQDSALMTWFRDLDEAMESTGRSIRIDANTVRDTLDEIGFDEVNVETIMIPLNPWNRQDKRLCELGKWGHLALTHSIESFSLQPFLGILNRTRSELDILLRQVQKDISTMAYKPYCYVHIITARAPTVTGQ